MSVDHVPLCIRQTHDKLIAVVQTHLYTHHGTIGVLVVQAAHSGGQPSLHFQTIGRFMRKYAAITRNLTFVCSLGRCLKMGFDLV